MKKLFFMFILVFVFAIVGCSEDTSTSDANDSGSSSETSEGNKDEVEEKVMKLAIVVPEERSQAQGLIKFGELVEEKTDGAIKAELYPDGQLGGDRDVLEGLQLGTIQGTTTATALVANFVPEFNVFDFPFLFKDKETAYEVLDGPVGERLLEKLPEENIIGLSYWENGFRHLTNDDREVTTMEDIEGLKIRTMENSLHIDAWKELGASPDPIAYDELYTALQQGVVDGQENPYGNVKTANFYEVQDYLTNTGHVYNASVFMLSKQFWDGLSDNEKEIMREAAEEARDYQRELNKEEAKESLEFVRNEGMTISELEPGEKEKIQEKLQPVYEKYTEEIGQDLVNEVFEAAGLEN